MSDTALFFVAVAALALCVAGMCLP